MIAMKVGIANDHHGVELKQKLTKILTDLGYNIINYGTDSLDMVDYCDYAFKIGESVASREIDYGILLCNTGIGMSIACNKVRNVRCAKVSNVYEAKMTRRDNDANVIALSSKLSLDELKDIIITFLTTDYANIERYNRRIEKINNYDN